MKKPALSFQLFLILLLFSSPICFSQEFLVFPKRVEFTPSSEKIALLTIHNPGNNSIEVNVDLVDYRMERTGEFQLIPDTIPPLWSARNHLRFYPRHVKLAPNKSQILKIQWDSNIPQDKRELRSHLVFISQEEFNLEEETNNQSTQGLNISIKPRIGIGIPVIIKEAEKNATCSIQNFKLTQSSESASIEFELNREEDYSCYGNIQIKGRTRTGQLQTIKEIAGVAVYTNLHSRHIKIPLHEIHLSDLEELIVEFRDAFDKEQKYVYSFPVSRL